MVVTQATTYVGLSNQSVSCDILGSKSGVGTELVVRGSGSQWDTRRRFGCFDPPHASRACLPSINDRAPVEKVLGSLLQGRWCPSSTKVVGFCAADRGLSTE